MTPKQGPFFLENGHILTPNPEVLENRVHSQKTQCPTLYSMPKVLITSTKNHSPSFFEQGWTLLHSCIFTFCYAAGLPQWQQSMVAKHMMAYLMS